jgi:transcription elongation factor Elf1
MSIWIDQKYIGTLSVRLDKFVRKGDYNYNFRCPICGDSQTNRNKARGYIYAQKGGLFYKCHNCAVSISFGNLIKAVDPNLYKEYCLERYKEGESGRKAHKEHGFVFKPVTFGSNKTDNLRGVLTPLSKLDNTHEAIVYARSRKIPEDKLKKLYYVDNVQKLKVFSPDYEDKIVTEEPRIVLPFYDNDDELVGLSCRAIRGEKLRYLVMKIKADSPMIYNMNGIDTTQTIFVTEGPLDSLFLPNAVAAGNSNLKVVINHLPKDKLVLIYDNEPRNKEIVREIGEAVGVDVSLVIWPKSYQEKDINDMILSGKSQNEILDTINKFTFRGPKALLEFNIWKMR